MFGKTLQGMSYGDMYMQYMGTLLFQITLFLHQLLLLNVSRFKSFISYCFQLNALKIVALSNFAGDHSLNPQHQLI